MNLDYLVPSSSYSSSCCDADISTIKKFMCPICWDIWDEPALTPCCHVFCKLCITLSVHKIGSSCPVCKKTFKLSDLSYLTNGISSKSLSSLSSSLHSDSSTQSHFSFTSLSSSLQSRINLLKEYFMLPMHCDLCNEKMNLSFLKEHWISRCPLVKCKYHIYGCTEKLSRKYIAIHENKLCNYHLIRCCCCLKFFPIKTGLCLDVMDNKSKTMLHNVREDNDDNININSSNYINDNGENHEDENRSVIPYFLSSFLPHFTYFPFFCSAQLSSSFLFFSSLFYSQNAFQETQAEQQLAFPNSSSSIFASSLSSNASSSSTLLHSSVLLESNNSSPLWLCSKTCPQRETEKFKNQLIELIELLGVSWMICMPSMFLLGGVSMLLGLKVYRYSRLCITLICGALAELFTQHFKSAINL